MVETDRKLDDPNGEAREHRQERWEPQEAAQHRPPPTLAVAPVGRDHRAVDRQADASADLVEGECPTQCGRAEQRRHHGQAQEGGVAERGDEQQRADRGAVPAVVAPRADDHRCRQGQAPPCGDDRHGQIGAHRQVRELGDDERRDQQRDDDMVEPRHQRPCAGRGTLEDQPSDEAGEDDGEHGGGVGRWMRSPGEGYQPLKSGVRRSPKALIPSAMSAVAVTSSWA